MKNITDLIGRIFIGAIFLYEAYDSIFYYKATKELMTEYHVVWQQDLLLIGAIFLLFFGGLSVVTGYRSSLGAFLLILYWIPYTFIVHSFWNDPLPIRRDQSILFMKNIAITGGLLIVMVNGSQRISIKRLFATTRVKGQ